jgi:phosphate-selective porin OprO/OprP
MFPSQRYRGCFSGSGSLCALIFLIPTLWGQEPIPPSPFNADEAETYILSEATAEEAQETDDDPLMAELRRLQQRIDQLESNQKKAAVSQDAKPNTPAAPAFPTFKITGFTQFDSAWYSQDPENIATVGDAQDGSGFRRARFAVNGKVAEFTSYQLEVDFATAGRPSFFDCFVEQGNLPYVGNVKIGQYCQPFSVDSFTGFRNLTFLERSLPFLAMVPFRRIGVQISDTTEDQKTAWAYSLYRSGGFNNAPLGDDRFATDFGDIGGYAFSGRLTHLLYYDDLADDCYLWHIGGGYNFSFLGANDAVGSGTAGNAGSPRPFYQARTSPEFGSLGYPELSSSFGSAVNGTPSFVDTGRYEADHFQLVGLETVCQAGPWGLTAEYMATTVNSVVGPVFYQGAYIQAAYRLTGEHRVYDKRNGALGKLVPFTDFIPLRHDGVKGWGAWEVAARWSVVDLRNPDDLDGHYYSSSTNTFTGTSKAGNGTLNDSTVGVTWFLNVHTKMQFNWIHAMLDNTATGWSQADLFVTRVQVDF